MLAGVLVGERAVAGIRRTLLGRHVTALVVDSRQGRFLVPIDDLGVAGRLAFTGAYEPGALTLYKGLVRPSDRLLVVGAHVGTLVVPLAKMVSRVVAVEANPRIYELLRMNVALNDVTNVELHCLAALDGPGEVEFLDSRVNSGGSKIVPRQRRFEFVYDHPRVVTVGAGRLDDVLRPAEFDVVLMDIEGAEYRAMLGMQHILSHARLLVCELIPNHLDNVTGVTLEQFTHAIPPNFTEFAFVTQPENRVPRADLPLLYRRAADRAYFGGTDLLCAVSPPSGT
jgi:FkbM family methyltransferase